MFKFLFPGQVYDGHQALGDVKALVHILGTPVVSQACGFLLPYAPGGLRCDVQRWATPAEAWVPPVRKSRGQKVGSVAGQCLCTSKCVTPACPCRAGGVVCTEKCWKHTVHSCKCVNKAAGAPQPLAPVVPVARLGDGTLDPAQDATTV